MKTQVLKILPLKENDSLQVWICIGEKLEKFTFSRNFEQIGEVKLAIITYNNDFGETFKFNQHLVAEVVNLVKKYYHGNALNLPQEIGDFSSAEIALALQKPFKYLRQLHKTISKG
jgi:hypothetical protein